MEKVLIIGGGGFVGSNIADYLISNRDYQIDIVDNFSRGKNEKIVELENSTDAKRIKIINADLTINESFNFLGKDYDYVYMLAAMVGVDKVNAIPHEVIRVNSLLTINVLEWLKKIKCQRVIFSSTSETYAGTIEAFGYEVPTNESVPLTIENVSHPRFTYAITKMLGESGFINYANQDFFESVIVRYHNVYGPMMGFRHVIPHLVERFSKKENPFLIYGHDQTRSFNFIGDAVEGTVLAIEKGINKEIYHIGNDEEISIETLTKHIGKKLNYDGTYEHAPTFPGSVSRRCPDIGKARDHLGYSPKVNWKNGIDKTVEWYLDYLSRLSKPSESFYDQYGIKR